MESENKHHYALVVGIKDYPQIPNVNLPNAHTDAEAVANWLAGPYGRLPKQNIQMVLSEIDDGNPLPTIVSIQNAFAKLFESAHSVTPDKVLERRLYVYFAAHGFSSPSSMLQILLANADPENMEACLDTEAYQKRLAQITLFMEQIFLYDCCRKFDNQLTGYGPSWATLNRADPEGKVAQIKQVIYYAAGLTQTANARPVTAEEYKLPPDAGALSPIVRSQPTDIRLWRGLFTQVLLDALRGGASDGNRTVTENNLRSYVQAKLDQLTLPLFLQQRPNWLISNVPDKWPIVTSVPPCTVEVTLSVGSEWHSGIVNSSDNRETIIQPFRLENGHATIHLSPNTYLLLLSKKELKIGEALELTPDLNLSVLTVPVGQTSIIERR